MPIAKSTAFEQTETTANLRWNDGVLEQEHRVTRFVDGKAQSQSTRWEPVPEKA